jgi:hypothetical protein
MEIKRAIFGHLSKEEVKSAKKPRFFAGAAQGA